MRSKPFNQDVIGYANRVLLDDDAGYVRPCYRCEYFGYPSDNVFTSGSGEGTCQRFPPTYVGDDNEDSPAFGINWEQPLVGIYCTCGEWKDRERY